VENFRRATCFIKTIIVIIEDIKYFKLYNCLIKV
jgi:hypothetical protein